MWRSPGAVVHAVVAPGLLDVAPCGGSEVELATVLRIDDLQGTAVEQLVARVTAKVEALGPDHEHHEVRHHRDASGIGGARPVSSVGDPPGSSGRQRVAPLMPATIAAIRRPRITTSRATGASRRTSSSTSTATTLSWTLAPDQAPLIAAQTGFLPCRWAFTAARIAPPVAPSETA